MNQIWVPKGTEILTVEGWSKVEYLYNRGGDIMTVNLAKRKIERQRVTQLQQTQSKGKINEIRSEFSLIRFQSGVLIPKKDIFDGFDEIPSISHTFKQVGYGGLLFSFQSGNNTAILRNPFKGISIASRLDLDEGLFTQDEYEDRGEVGYLDNIEADEILESRWAKHKERPKEVSSTIPDYWISRTSW